MVLHNVSNYGYHFIIKEVAEEFKGEFIFLGAHTEKYKVVSVLITIEVKRVFKNGKEPTKTIFYRRQFIDSARFMASSLSGLVNNLAEGVHKIKCKYEHNNKKIEPCGIRYKDCEWRLEYPSVKNYLIEYKCIYCVKNNRKNLTKIWKRDLFINTNFLTMIPINLFYSCEWINGKNSVKHYYQIKKIFTVIWTKKIFPMQITHKQNKIKIKIKLCEYHYLYV